MVIDWTEYVHKPTRVRAVQWDGTAIPADAFSPEERARHGLKPVGKKLCIRTLRGLAYAEPGDYIVVAPWGEVWPIKPHVFEQAYVPATEAT